MKNQTQKRKKIFTWHIHGSYLYYLSQTNSDIFLPTKPGTHEGYTGKSGPFPWPDTVHEIPAEEVKNYDFDLILFQSKKNYQEDQYEILSPRQRTLPKVYLEHDPPQQHPTDTIHWVQDPSTTLVQVTHFNDLMWDTGITPTKVIEHGAITPPPVTYTGTIPKGIVVINNLKERGRRLGYDIFEKVRKEIPLDIVGMNSKEIGGLGEVPHHELPAFIAQYRFFFHPVRYTSLALSLVEAMMVGMPVVALSTTEITSVIKNGVNGYADTNIQKLVVYMHLLLENEELAHEIGRGAKITAQQKYNIHRFSKDWEQLFTLLTEKENILPNSPSMTKGGII